jgi:hypothetical protein
MIMVTSRLFGLSAAVSLLLCGQALAQVTSVDPNSAGQPGSASESDYQPVDAGSQDPGQPVQPPADSQPAYPSPAPVTGPAPGGAPQGNRNFVPPTDTIPKNDVLAAAENVFGRGAEGLGAMMESILRDQGEPVAYIAGKEAGGALVVGVRYGSGTMRHRIEGDRPVYWTGPTVGFDAGADANKVFVLVYNLHDTEDLFRRYPAAEGHAYVVGGLTASYLRRGDVVLIPIRLGVGLRLGVNAGYMKFSKKSRAVPF